MKHYSLEQLAGAMSGALPAGGGELIVSTGVGTDTRKVESGSLFFALKGENFNAHDFLSEALQEGAVAVVIDEAQRAPEGAPVIVVDDVLSALQRLAKWYLKELDLVKIAITGSNGKTSTKDMVKAVLSERFRVNATLGNLNNHIGLPLTVLATSETDEVGIFEMGMNHPGEIAPLCEIAPPDLSLITSVGTAHIEHMGSREGIAKEKGVVGQALGPDGTLIVPADCDFLDYFQKVTPGKVLVAGEGGEVFATEVRPQGNGMAFQLHLPGDVTVAVQLPVTGLHMVSNALLAAACGCCLGLGPAEIKTGLEKAVLSGGRLRQLESEGVVLIDDTYNANPDSMQAAIRTLAALPSSGRRVACLGAMAELGEHALSSYEELGRALAASGVSDLVAVGEETLPLVEAAKEAVTVRHFSAGEEAAQYLVETIVAGEVILFKGSRSAAMEKVMDAAFPNPSLRL